MQSFPADLRAAWRVSQAKSIAETRSSSVFRALREDGTYAIAKLLKPAGLEERHGMTFLEWRNGLGATRMLERRGDACLIEDAGNETLAEFRLTDGDAACLPVLTDIVRALHAPSALPAPAGLVPLPVRFQALFERAHLEADPLQRELLQWAAGLAEGLLARQSGIRPLHGDIHHENVVRGGPRGWLAIDPHGLIGDPAYDLANIFSNPLNSRNDVLDPRRILQFVTHLADALDLDEETILGFAVAHAALSLCWYLEDDEDEDDRRHAEDERDFVLLGRMLIHERNIFA